MKSKLIVFTATLATLSCFYLVKLNEKVVDSESVSESPDPIVIDPQVIQKTASAIDEIDDFWKPVVSKHVLNPSTENKIVGKKGTVISFPAGAFTDMNGFGVSGSISLTLEECYSIPEMLQAKLSTTSDTKLLETAGMVKITAKCGNKELKIGDGKTYTISFPKQDNPKDDFRLFYGERNSDGIMNWKLALEPESNVDDSNPKESAATSAMTNRVMNRDDCFIRITESYLRRDLKISEMDYFNWKFLNGQGLNQWFVAGFNPDVEMVNDFCSQRLECQVTFKLKPDGRFDSYYISRSSGELYDDIIVSYLKTMPALDMNVLMPKFTFEHACILTFGSKFGREQSDIASEIRQRISKKPDDEIDVAASADIDYYVFTSSQLGWINCDRFEESEEPLVDFYVEHNASDQCAVSMVFDDINSVVKGVNEGAGTIFSGVPGGKNVRIIAIDDRGGTPVMSVLSANTDQKKSAMKNYKKFSLNELDKTFSKNTRAAGVPS
jgi:hypothetical protein